MKKHKLKKEDQPVSEKMRINVINTLYPIEILECIFKFDRELGIVQVDESKIVGIYEYYNLLDNYSVDFKLTHATEISLQELINYFLRKKFKSGSERIYRLHKINNNTFRFLKRSKEDRKRDTDKKVEVRTVQKR